MAVEDRASSDRAIPTWLVGTAVATLGLAFAPAMGIAAAAWHGTAVLLAIAATVLLVARTSDMLQWQQAGTALASGALMVGLFVTIVRLVAVVGPPEGSDIVRRVSMLAAPIAAYFAVLAATVVIGGGAWNGRRARVSTTGQRRRDARERRCPHRRNDEPVATGEQAGGHRDDDAPRRGAPAANLGHPGHLQRTEAGQQDRRHQRDGQGKGEEAAGGDRVDEVVVRAVRDGAWTLEAAELRWVGTRDGGLERFRGP